MENITSTYRKSQLRTKRKATDSFISPREVVPENRLFTLPGNDVSETFSDYIALLRIPGDLNLMVLPSSKHYYYETKDLKKVKILVNPRQLNDIKNIKDFLRNLSSVLQMKSYFIGTFFNNKDKNIFLSDPHEPPKVSSGPCDLVENGISSRVPFLNLLSRLIDFRIEKYLTKTAVNLQLEEVSLKVLNMTEINGLTYFCAQKWLTGS